MNQLIDALLQVNVRKELLIDAANREYPIGIDGLAKVLDEAKDLQAKCEQLANEIAQAQMWVQTHVSLGEREPATPPPSLSVV
jgi:hypothetical protein